MTDTATYAAFQVNVLGEKVCEFTGMVTIGCSHCQGLPWGEDPSE